MAPGPERSDIVDEGGHVGAAAGARPPHDAVIFDLDGVVTDTAELHAAAWKQLFDDVLADERFAGARSREPFDERVDYRRYVDGRSREDGIASFLSSRGVEVPIGSAEDPADAWTIHAMAERKDTAYVALLAHRGVRVFDGTAQLLRRLRAGRVPLALVSASRNARAVLDAADLTETFDVVIDGVEASERGLEGKPHPAMFLEAARELGVEPARAAVLEDAVSGVAAARRGGFGLVVGIDRGGQRRELEAAGADLVVDDASQLDLGALRADPWLLVYEGFDSAHESHREALTTLANGYLGTRGAAPERTADGVHYPGTYVAGLYNRLTSLVHGRAREDEHLVNVPNWLPLELDAPWSTEMTRVIDECRELDLRRGVLTRTAVLVDPDGRRMRLRQRRIVSMARPHLASLETTLVAEGWSDVIRVRSGIDAGVTNTNVGEYALLANRHLRTIRAGEDEDRSLVVETQTTQSQVHIATALRTTVRDADVHAVVEHDGDRHFQVFGLTLQDGQPITIDKTVAIVTSREPAIASPRLAAMDELAWAPGGFADLLPAHEAAWKRLWKRFEIELDANVQTRLALNLHIFHLIQSASPHTAGRDAGVPVRGLHGEGYRGHVFWDEAFVLPVLSTRLPAISRSLLEYRWRRLDAARRVAFEAGLDGAMFPWQSGSTGREETPRELYNPRSGKWMADNSSRQRHVGLAVAFNTWQYYQSTGDVNWLARRGIDLIVEVVRLFTALATHDETDDRFHIEGVMGPDEFHDGYPDAPGRGVRDNAYTNVLAAWLCQRVGEALAEISGIDCDDAHARLRIRRDEPAMWETLSRRLAVPFHEGVISQFAGYERLAGLDWARYRATYGNLGRLDLILNAEDDTTNRYQVTKQADVIMLVYLLGPDGVGQMLDRLGYDGSTGIVRRSIDYYLERTAHGSTLSRVAHASVLARTDPERAWSTFREALTADLDDTQGGTTQEGIHLGAMAGTLDIVSRSFAGLRIEGDVLVLDPRLPDELRMARFGLQHRGQRVEITLRHEGVRVAVDPCASNSTVSVRVAGQTVTVEGGQACEIAHARLPLRQADTDAS